MTTDQIRYFLALATQLNFRAVAERFFITQPTLTRQIAGLEEELGVKLFVRNTRMVKLTEAGLTLYTGLQEIYQNLVALVNQTKETAARKNRYLSIALQDDQLLSEEIRLAVQRFAQRYPDTHITLSRVPQNKLFDGLMRGEYDFGNCLDLDGHYLRNYSFITLTQEPGCIAMQRELATGYLEYILPEEANQLIKRVPIHLITSDHFETISEPVQALRSNFHLEFSEDCCRLEGEPMSIPLKIGAGLCLTVVNRTHIMDNDPDISLIPVKGAKPYRKVLIYKKTRTNPAADEFLDILGETDTAMFSQ